MIYFDSSALIKMIAPEPESQALSQWIRDRWEQPRVTSALSKVDVLRNFREQGPAADIARRHRAGQVPSPGSRVPDGHHRIELDGARLELEVRHNLLSFFHDDPSVRRDISQHPRSQAVGPGGHPGNREPALSVRLRAERSSGDRHGHPLDGDGERSHPETDFGVAVPGLIVLVDAV